MSIPTGLASFFRGQWEDRLVDTCVIKRATSQTLNTTTGSYAVTYSTSFSGACLVRPSSPDDAVSGEQKAELRYYNVIVPYTVTDLEPEDLVDVTTTFDSYLNGRQLTVRNVAGDSYNHVRRLRCEEVVTDV